MSEWMSWPDVPVGRGLCAACLEAEADAAAVLDGDRAAAARLAQTLTARARTARKGA